PGRARGLRPLGPGGGLRRHDLRRRPGGPPGRGRRRPYDTAGRRRAPLRRPPVRSGRAVLHGADAPRHTGRHGVHRRRRQRCHPGRGGAGRDRREAGPSAGRVPGGWGEVIPRYSIPEMAELFSDEAKFRTWLEIEVLAVEAWSQLGVVPAADAVAVRERAPAITPATITSIAERERVTDHDVAAFVDVVQDAIGPPAGAWVHYGLTSSDVVDTALGVTLNAAADLLVQASGELVSALERRPREL